MLQGVGVGLKPEHVNCIVSTLPDLQFFEIHAENYLVAGGPFHQHLAAICAHYALSIHGVGLSLAGEHPLDIHHLAALKRLIERYQPALFSEHLAWAGHGGYFYNDLLPIAYTDSSLARVSERIDFVQQYLGRQILIENPSSYVEFTQSTWSEAEFLKAIVARTGCGLLLDVNNVFVSCHNHGWDCQAYLNALPLQAVQEIHLAGHACERDAQGKPVLIDNHGSAVAEPVWQLLATLLPRLTSAPLLLEWDSQVPECSQLLAQAQQAKQLQPRVLGGNLQR